MFAGQQPFPQPHALTGPLNHAPKVLPVASTHLNQMAGLLPHNYSTGASASLNHFIKCQVARSNHRHSLTQRRGWDITSLLLSPHPSGWQRSRRGWG